MIKLFKVIFTIVVIFFYSKLSYTQTCNSQLSNELKSTEVFNHLFYKKYDYYFSGIYDQFNGSYNADTYYFNNYNPTGPNLYNELTNLEPLAYVIESFIIMYETTKDKAYLIKAVNKSIDLINKRGTISAIVGLMTNNRNSIKLCW